MTTTSHAQALYILRLERKLADRESALQELFPTLEAVESERDSFRNELVEMQDLHARSVRTQQEERKQYRKDVAYLVDELRCRAVESREKQADLLSSQSEVRRLSGAIDTLHHAAESKESMLQADLEATSSALNTSNEENAALCTSLAEAQSLLSTSQANEAHIQSALDSTETELLSTKEQVEARMEDLDLALKAEADSRKKADEANEARGRMASLLQLSRSAEEGLRMELASYAFFSLTCLDTTDCATERKKSYRL